MHTHDHTCRHTCRPYTKMTPGLTEGQGQGHQIRSCDFLSHYLKIMRQEITWPDLVALTFDLDLQSAQGSFLCMVCMYVCMCGHVYAWLWVQYELLSYLIFCLTCFWIVCQALMVIRIWDAWGYENHAPIPKKYHDTVNKHFIFLFCFTCFTVLH